jgi:uncharacterized protein (TIGR00255 family)
MIRSMTGYSKSSAGEDGCSVTASIKSTNHRFLDVQVRLPAGLDALEPLIRRVVKRQVARGHLEITIGLEQTAAVSLQVNRALVQGYAAACRQLREDYGFTGESDPMALLRIPGVVSGGSGEVSSAELERIQRVIEQAILEALRQLNEMRGREGAALERDLRMRFERLQELCGGVEALSEQLTPLYRRRLEDRVREILGSVGVDPARLAQEVAYLVSRSDVAEELTRFRSHLEQCRHLLNTGVNESTETGKKLDFLLQELNREANTLLSKTTDVPEIGVEIGRQAIEMKTEVEKLSEQAQNIE